LPIALEKVLAFKDARVSQVGMKPDDLERVEKGDYIHAMIEFCTADMLTVLQWSMSLRTV